MSGAENAWPVLIRNLRQFRNLTQSALAQMVGVDQVTVSRWETGRNVPEIAMQRRLRDFLARPADDRRLFASVALSFHPRYLFRTDLEVRVGGPSRILEVSEGLVAQQPLGRSGIFRPLTRFDVEAIQERDALLNSLTPFFGARIRVADLYEPVLIYRNRLDSSPERRHARVRLTTLALSDGTPACLYERQLVPPDEYAAWDRQVRIRDVDEMML